MTQTSLPRLLVFLLLSSFATSPIAAQQNCQAPSLPAVTIGQNIFSELQENDLGDAVAEQLQRDYRVIDDAEVTNYLRRIGERIIQNLPPSKLHFQFFLFDINDVNAFTLPGGRIYVSRKMVAFARNEDELAGVIAHELGHIVARHSTIDMTILFREVLDVTQVTDRRDIFEKYNRLIENTARRRKAFEKLENHEEGNQNVADLVGLHAMVRAGYNPQAQTELWDRYFQLKGKTGGFLADLFGRTKPEQKRLREMLKGLGTLPPECLGTRVASTSEDFRQWQSSVVSYSGLGRKESLGGLIQKKPLNPSLRSDIGHLRFSQDGKLILAQDDSGINVFTREPLASLFRINAPDAKPAQFTPDSRQIVFYTPNLRVEFWDIAEQKLKTAQEVIVRKSCLQTSLSPDGKALGCLDSDYGLNLFEVATGASLFEKKGFSQMGFSDVLSIIFSALMAQEDVDIGEHDFINMAFSPDGRYFVAGDRSLNFTQVSTFNSTISSDIQALVFDLTTHTPVPVKGDLKKIIGSGFAFVGADKIVGRNMENSKKSGLYKFPSGEVIRNFEMFNSSLAPVTAGEYVLVKGFGKLSGSLLDLKTQKVFNFNQRPMLDVYEDVVASQLRSSQLGLSSLTGGAPQAVPLPQDQLGRLYAVDVSPDFKWLALSGNSRGAVWDLAQGKMVYHLRGFRGAYIGDDKIVHADFPKQDEVERNIVRMSLATTNIVAGPQVESYSAKQYGAVVVQTKPAKKGGGYWENVTMEVQDAKTLSLLWSMSFPKERPRYWLSTRSGTMTLGWPVTAKAAAAEIKEHPALVQQLSTLKEKEGDYLLKVLDVKTGQMTGELLIETGKGSFQLRDVFVSGDWVTISDSENRTLVYSLASGRQKGKVFGSRAALSAASNLLCVENESGLLTLYDLVSFEKRQQYAFDGPLALVRFSPDGNRLFILTVNQIVYLLDVSSFAAPKLAQAQSPSGSSTWIPERAFHALNFDNFSLALVAPVAIKGHSTYVFRGH